ncbi:PIN domain-containing protein [Vineibacter terrae]|uniref:PIN domain-containing protein n=1 Tax=Vineibacter terrae TaxID=2586908 RepID=UPI002E34A552|nr:PIN domain-containing protein [Vineibacter terrae]HEX2888540.1 PIN domain-containing protein [Vineibacter terrae]
MPVFLDANILIYSISTAADESGKRDKALTLLDRDDCVLSVQVLQEFYVEATRASRPDRLSHEIATGLIRTWMRFRIQDTTVAVLQGALEIRAAHGFSFWDSAIIAAARVGGCGELYTEDLSHGRIVDGVMIVNPFR